MGGALFAQCQQSDAVAARVLLTTPPQVSPAPRGHTCTATAPPVVALGIHESSSCSCQSDGRASTQAPAGPPASTMVSHRGRRTWASRDSSNYFPGAALNWHLHPALATLAHQQAWYLMGPEIPPAPLHHQGKGERTIVQRKQQKGRPRQLASPAGASNGWLPYAVSTPL